MGTRGSSNIFNSNNTALMSRAWEVKWICFPFFNTYTFYSFVCGIYSYFTVGFYFYSYLSILVPTGSIAHALLVSHASHKSTSNHDVSQALLIAQWWNLFLFQIKLKGNNNQMVSSLHIWPTLRPFWLLASSRCKNVGKFLAWSYSINKLYVNNSHTHFVKQVHVLF